MYVFVSKIIETRWNLPTWLYRCAYYTHVYRQTDTKKKREIGWKHLFFPSHHQHSDFNSNNDDLINFQNYTKVALYLDLNAYKGNSVPNSSEVFASTFSSLFPKTIQYSLLWVLHFLVQTVEIKKLTYVAEIFQAL